MAFGVHSKGNNRISSDHKHMNGAQGEPAAAQWDEWQRIDKEVWR